MRARDFEPGVARRLRNDEKSVSTYRYQPIFNKHNEIHYLPYPLDKRATFISIPRSELLILQETHRRIVHAAGQLTWLRSVMRVQCTSLRDPGARSHRLSFLLLPAVYKWKWRHRYADTADSMQNNANDMPKLLASPSPLVFLCIERPSWRFSAPKRYLKWRKKGLPDR